MSEFLVYPADIDAQLAYLRSAAVRKVHGENLMKSDFAKAFDLLRRHSKGYIGSINANVNMAELKFLSSEARRIEIVDPLALVYLNGLEAASLPLLHECAFNDDAFVLGVPSNSGLPSPLVIISGGGTNENPIPGIEICYEIPNANGLHARYKTTMANYDAFLRGIAPLLDGVDVDEAGQTFAEVLDAVVGAVCRLLVCKGMGAVITGPSSGMVVDSRFYHEVKVVDLVLA